MEIEKEEEEEKKKKEEGVLGRRGVALICGVTPPLVPFQCMMRSSFAFGSAWLDIINHSTFNTTKR